MAGTQKHKAKMMKLHRLYRKTTDPDCSGTSDDVANKKSLYIVGPNGFDNELFADFLQTHTGFCCHCQEIEGFKNIIGKSDGNTRLILLDCRNLREIDLWKLLNTDREYGSKKSLLLLTQVKAEWKIEQRALDYGVRGILYDTQAFVLYPKAVKAVFNGELWYPRSVLEARLLIGNNESCNEKKTAHLLSKREKEILALLAAGLSNQAIAEKLCISPHTVKTHAYNIYKKIKVDNRMHAALWLLNST